MTFMIRYTGKDQVRPLNAVVKQRNCHIKFAAYDDEVLIIGNGNQGRVYVTVWAEKLADGPSRQSKLVSLARGERHAGQQGTWHSSPFTGFTLTPHSKSSPR